MLPNPSSETGSTNDVKEVTFNVPSLHGMVKVLISPDQVDPNPMFFSGIAQILPSLVPKDWDSGTVSITLSMPDGDTLQVFMSVLRLGTTAT